MSGGKVALEGLRVFVVEDEFAVLLLVEDMLVQLGCAVVASVSRIAPALEIARSGAFDAAVLDINVAGEAIYPVVEILASRNVPIAFSTGYGARRGRRGLAGVADLAKTLFRRAAGARLVAGDRSGGGLRPLTRARNSAASLYVAILNGPAGRLIEPPYR